MPAPFQLLAAHPALDFVNTLDNRFADTGPAELLPRYADLLSFMEQSKLLELRQINALRRKGDVAGAAAVLRRAHDLRETLAVVFYGVAEKGKPPEASLKRLEQYALLVQRHRELVWSDSPGRGDAVFRAAWTWGRFENQPALPLWAIAQSATELLQSSAISHVHACASETCRWLFLDTSKNHSRRWCEMAICGNRVKVRRFQARR
jgi:predicted RNA-binding Zn ribbon-like protein